MESRNYCLAEVYGGTIINKQDFNAGHLFKWTFGYSPASAIYVAVDGDKAPLAMEITSLVVGLGIIAGAATAGVLFLKPIIEQAAASVMENAVDAATAEVLKQMASISTIVVGSAVIGTLAYILIKHAIAAGIVAVNESDAKGK